MRAPAEAASQVAEALAVLRARGAVASELAITLGSGLGAVAGALSGATRVPTREIPHWPASTVAGHEGALVFGRLGAVPTVVLAGRSHRYEGYALSRVTFAVRVMRALGARVALFTNAVGAIHPELAPGDLMLAVDHINFIGRRGLLNAAELKSRGAARAHASPYSPRLAAQLEHAALDAGVVLRRGTLLGGLGPSYETAAEIRMAEMAGADAVCMSTVHEVSLAAELGLECASISCVSNRATGLSAQRLTHAEVQEVAGRAAERLARLLEAYARGLAAS
ncbi:MAG: purine-nucleoside phosphorylase [Candidatus Eiseniibacteriota bacterium]